MIHYYSQPEAREIQRWKFRSKDGVEARLLKRQKSSWSQSGFTTIHGPISVEKPFGRVGWPV